MRTDKAAKAIVEPEIRPGVHGKLIAHDGFRDYEDRPCRDMDTFRLEARARAKRTKLNYRTLGPRKVCRTQMRKEGAGLLPDC